MAGDDDVGKGEQAREDVVLDDPVGEVPEEKVALLLVDVQTQVSYPTALEPIDRRLSVDEGRRGWC